MIKYNTSNSMEIIKIKHWYSKKSQGRRSPMSTTSTAMGSAVDSMASVSTMWPVAYSWEPCG